MGSMSKSPKRKSPAKRQADTNPATVPFAAIPTGETPGIDEWAHRAVWTDRMLATLLENKVRGGRWHTLIDKVFKRLCRNHRWPNAYFAERGFTSLCESHSRFAQTTGTY